MGERERRLGENEVIYREVNERVRELTDDFGLDQERLELVCECSRLDCAERLRLTLAEYEAVRADPVQFVLLPGHEVLDIEEVVARHDGYVVVRKRPGEPAEVAIRTA
jgi:hypothetical protein